ncbi:substrate-binding domain-containing protein [Neoactinobaculum massilliense]|uniref:substrate-binding domain-containing protein n=1 Tax=Neoactinobaculum massilliense TaxID=2364794 RepID=UPI000F52EEE3|nr:substrate-binding domain-containing protein [Neoactinobaculum massilliense]
MRVQKLLALGAVTMLGLVGCSSTGGAAREKASAQAASGCTATTSTVAVVSHGVQGDPFWDVVKRGAEDAGKRYCVNVTYQGQGDPQAQSQAIDNAVAQKVDGLVVSMANPQGLKDSVEAAVAAGVPVVTINSGEAESASYGALVHIGQNEKDAGGAAGEQFKKAGDKHVLCVIHEAGNIAQESRCQGAEKALGIPMTRLQVEIANLSEAQTTIQTALNADPSIDGVFTLNSAVATAAAPAIESTGRKITLGTMDLDSDTAGLISKKQLDFAVDQQPYLQGYLGVEEIVLHNQAGLSIGGGKTVATGPNIVNASNIDVALAGIKAGMR